MFLCVGVQDDERRLEDELKREERACMTSGVSL